jgi:predicted nucleic acid-binding protein
MVRTKSVVVTDAGPIIHLDELQCLDILADFDGIFITQSVKREIQHHRPDAMTAFSGLFIERNPCTYSPLMQTLTPIYTLHQGEQEALQLCLESGHALLLTDDTAARLAAKSLGIAAHGTLGLLIRAIRQQSRSKSDVLKLLRDIPVKTTLHIRPALLADIVAQVESNPFV